MLKLSKVSVSAGKKTIVKGVSFALSPGEIVVLMGPNGSGKSSLSLALAGHPSYRLQGKASLDGKLINKLGPEQRARLGLFLGLQNPITIPGLGIISFIWRLSAKLKAKTRPASANLEKQQKG
jgi:Fe-S cluster assembly ATP-binding protein